MDAKRLIGKIIRFRRESLKLSQERVAEKANISYQYLSAVENGHENFSIGVLESISLALGFALPDLVNAAYKREFDDLDAPRISNNFLREVPLPTGLTLSHVEDALNETQRVIKLLNSSLIRAGGRALPSYVQANNFSGIVSNILSDSFDRLSPYKHNHDQRYPDLINRTSNGDDTCGLEIKTTIQIGKGGESHNGHSGWHLVACYMLDHGNGNILFIHVMFANLIGYTHVDSDWKYVGSRVNRESGSQRTETYNTSGVGTTKLRDGSAYLDKNHVSFKRWRPQHPGQIPNYSIFYGKDKA